MVSMARAVEAPGAEGSDPQTLEGQWGDSAKLCFHSGIREAQTKKNQGTWFEFKIIRQKHFRDLLNISKYPGPSLACRYPRGHSNIGI